MIKAVFIDIDDTLLDFGKCAKYSMAESFRDFSLCFEDNMFPLFEEINAGLWRQIEKGEITKDELYGRRWNTIFGKLNIHGADGNEFESHFLEHLSESAEHVDGALDLLTYLASKYKIYAVSNGPHSQQLKRLERAGLLDFFTEIFTSEKLGVQKPEKAFFDAVFKLSGAKPSETALIGDSLSADISGGEKMRVKTIWFNKKNAVNTASVSPDCTVYSLREIKNIL